MVKEYMTAVLILRKKEYPVEAGQTLKQALLSLSLQPESYLALRDGEMLVEQELVREGDRIKLVAVISGGVR